MIILLITTVALCVDYLLFRKKVISRKMCTIILYCITGLAVITKIIMEARALGLF